MSQDERYPDVIQGEMLSADFNAGTVTLKMHGDCTVGAGIHKIIPLEIYRHLESWEQRCAALYQVIGSMAHLCGKFGHDDIEAALDVAAGRGDMDKLLPWPKDPNFGTPDGQAQNLLADLVTLLLDSTVAIGPIRERSDYPPELRAAIAFQKQFGRGDGEPNATSSVSHG